MQKGRYWNRTGMQAGLRLVPARQQGKLPRKTVDESYCLEYGEGPLVHEVAPKKNEFVSEVEDFIADYCRRL